MNLSELHSIFLSSNGITTDTRKISSGQLFFALKGPNFDGNKYALQAIEGGCGFSLVDDKSIEKNDQFIYVENVLKTLQDLACFHRDFLGIPIVAITGSNGKTTTKELLRACLSAKFRTSATKGNLNNHIGVPLTLLSFTQETEIGIVELGTNDFGEIETLCQIAKPTHGIITSIGKAHLENLKDEDGVFREKTALFEYLDSHDGTLFVNKSSPKLAKYKTSNARSIFFSTEGNMDLKVDLKRNFPFTEIDIQIGEDSSCIKLDLFGSYNIQNIVGAISIAQHFDLSLSEIAIGLSKFKNAVNRCEIVEFMGNTIFLDAYNANPSSVQGAVSAFEAYEVPSKSLIIGDMLELGEHTISEHMAIINMCKSMNFDHTIFIGVHFCSLRKHTFPRAYFFENVEDARENFSSLMSTSEQYIFLKGSRGIGLEKMIA